MNKKEKQVLDSVIGALLKTLNPSLAGKVADEIVKDCIRTLKRELLDTPGYVSISPKWRVSKPLQDEVYYSIEFVEFKHE